MSLLWSAYILIVNEEIVKKWSDFCLGVEGWSTGFEVSECETEWRDTPPHSKKKCHSLHAMEIIRNWYVQTNTGIPEKVTVETSSHKSSKALLCLTALYCSAASSNCFHQCYRFGSHSWARSIIVFSCKLLFCLIWTLPCKHQANRELLSNGDTLSSPAWLQASLPVKFGGLGVRSAVDVAPSAFLASAHSTASLVHSILPTSLSPLFSPVVSCALSAWSSRVPDFQPPSGDDAVSQKIWDQPGVELVSRKLLNGAQSSEDRAWLLAASRKESGAWLNALPLSSVGLRLDDDSMRIAVGLRLGTPLCGPHQCCNCGQDVDSTGRHGLSCKYSKGRSFRHAALNDIIRRALSSANIPLRLEPPRLSRVDGRRPDGVSIMP